MSKHFEHALARTFGVEGLWSNHPADRGGKTMLGITEDLANKYGYDVTKLTVPQARRVYLKEFWQPLRLDEIENRHVAAEIFDTAVNMGPYWAVRCAQEAVLLLGTKLRIDGKIGAITIGALNKTARLYLPHLLAAMNGFQFVRYVDLHTGDPEWAANFIRGWMLRLEVPRELLKETA